MREDSLYEVVQNVIFGLLHRVVSVIGPLSNEPRVQITERSADQESNGEQEDSDDVNSSYHDQILTEKKEFDECGGNNEDSLIIFDEVIPSNPFASLIQYQDRDISLLDSDQYGTSLEFSRNSKHYKVHESENHRIINYLSRDYSQTFDKTIFDIPNRHQEVDDYRQTILKHYLPHEPLSRLDYSIIDPLLSNFHIDRVSDAEKRQRESIQDTVLRQREELKSYIKPLENDQLYIVQKAWDSPRYGPIVSNFQIDISSRDLTTLKDGHWLNDNIIDYYFNLITSNDSSVYGWTTHFFSVLESKGYQGVARWAKRRKLNLVEKDLVLVPINIMGTHWALAVIDNVSRTIKYYDSLTTNGNMRALKIIADYMNQEAKRVNSPINYDNYTFSSKEDTPQQNNGSDCGVFACTCANFITKRQSLKYSQKDMKVLRRRMAYEILKARLLQ